MDNIIEIIGEIDLITRDEYANGNIGYDAYVQITERLKKLHPLVKNNYFISPVSICQCSNDKSKPFRTEQRVLCGSCDKPIAG
jgi:hypothetical protein